MSWRERLARWLMPCDHDWRVWKDVRMHDPGLVPGVSVISEDTIVGFRRVFVCEKCKAQRTVKS